MRAAAVITLLLLCPAFVAADEFKPTAFFSGHNAENELKKIAKAEGLEIRARGSSSVGAAVPGQPEAATDARKTYDAALSGARADVQKLLDHYQAVVEKQLAQHGVDVEGSSGWGSGGLFSGFDFYYRSDTVTGYVRVIAITSVKRDVVIDVCITEH